MLPQQRLAFFSNRSRTLKRALQCLSLKMPFRWFGQVPVPDIFEGMVQCYPLEAVIQPQRPALFACHGGKDTFSQLLPLGDLLRPRLVCIHAGLCSRLEASAPAKTHRIGKNSSV